MYPVIQASISPRQQLTQAFPIHASPLQAYSRKLPAWSLMAPQAGANNIGDIKR